MGPPPAALITVPPGQASDGFAMLGAQSAVGRGVGWPQVLLDEFRGADA